MRRESRNNLIFLIALIALCLPGITLLVRKKLRQGPGPQLGFSSPVRREVPYVDPLPAGPELWLTYPPRLRAWVRELAPGAPAEWARISRLRSFELIEWAAGEGEARAAVLVWDPRVAAETARFSAGAAAGEVESIARVNVPPAALSELRQAGYLAPPATVPLVRLRFAGGVTAGEPLRLEGTRAGEPFADELWPADRPAGAAADAAVDPPQPQR